MAGALALLYWFFKKRDIFPYIFIRFMAVCLAGQFLLLVLYHTVHVTVDMKAVKSDASRQLIRSLIYSAVWVSFIVKSENVKRIFVCPYVRNEF